MCVAAAFACRELGLDVYEQTCVLTLPARIVCRFARYDITQFGLGVARAERVKPYCSLAITVKRYVLTGAHPVATFADKLY